MGHTVGTCQSILLLVNVACLCVTYRSIVSASGLILLSQFKVRHLDLEVRKQDLRFPALLRLRSFRSFDQVKTAILIDGGF